MRLPFPIPFVLLALFAGCTVPGETEDAGAVAMASSAGSFGIVRVERTMEPDALTAQPRALLGAAFARYKGIDGLAVTGLLGGRMTTVDTCALAGEDAGAFADPAADVELLDVGEIEVRVAGTRTRMLARMFPDLAGMVGGVFYAEDGTLGPARADVDEYVLSAEGADIPGFEVVVVAPQGLTTVTFGGRAAEAVHRLSRESDLELQWDAGDPRDRIEVDLVAGGDVLQCLARDDGFFAVPSDILARLGADSEARAVLGRVRTQVFDATGLDAAWVSVGSTTAYTLALE